MDGGPILIFLLMAVIFITLAIFAAIGARKRREALAELAARLGLDFYAANDSDIADRYEFLDQLDQGSNRYAFNVIQGVYRDHRVLAFDYHYETHSTGSKGQRQTHHHYLSFFILALPRRFPELRIYKEGFFSKIGQFIGFEDIDFESAEFSRQFCVRSKDKRFAYDVCNPRMIEYLLANNDLNVEIEKESLAIGFQGELSSEEFEANLNRLIEIRSRFPNYLFTQTTA